MDPTIQIDTHVPDQFPTEWSEYQCKYKEPVGSAWADMVLDGLSLNIDKLEFHAIIESGGTLVRSVGIVRAKARIGLKNLAYNMRRLVQLERLATVPP